MKKLISFLSSTKSLTISLVLFIILCVLSNTLFQCNFTYLTQTFHYSPAKAYELLDFIEEEGRHAHLLILLSDIVITILYTSFFLGILYRLSTKLTKNCHIITIITFLPLLLTFTQFLEIGCLAFILLDYSNRHMKLLAFTSLITCIKTILTPFFFILPLILLSVKIFQKKRK